MEIDNDEFPEDKQVLAKKPVIAEEEKKFVKYEYNGSCQICQKIIYTKNRGRHFVACNLLDTSSLPKNEKKGFSTGWNTLCLCPNCAAEYKYGSVSLFNFESDAYNTHITSDYDGYYEFNIEMQGEPRVLRYTPKHLLALQTALRYYLGDEEESSEAKPRVHIDAVPSVSTKVAILSSGNKCPSCGNECHSVESIIVIDKNGDLQDILAFKCNCGQIYLTHKLKDKCTCLDKLDVNYIKVKKAAHKPSKAETNKASHAIQKNIPASQVYRPITPKHPASEKVITPPTFVSNSKMCADCGKNVYKNTGYCYFHYLKRLGLL